MTRVIIIAGIDGSRWNNHGGAPKHLTVIDKVPLLQRTVKQFLKYTDDVVVFGIDERYLVEGAKLVTMKVQNPTWKDGAKLLVTKDLWSIDSRTVLVMGDVYFSNDAVGTIMKNKDELKFFLRSAPSALHKAIRPEIFAIAFNSSINNKMNMSILHIMSIGAAVRESEWSLYKYLVGNTTNGLFNNTLFVDIYDWTAGFDTPEELSSWEEQRKLARRRAK